MSLNIRECPYNPIFEQVSYFLAIFRNQYKGGFSKGVFCRIQCHARANKTIHKGIGPSSTFGTQSATVKRGVNVCKTKPFKKTLSSLVPDLFSSFWGRTKPEFPPPPLLFLLWCLIYFLLSGEGQNQNFPPPLARREPLSSRSIKLMSKTPLPEDSF